jgi:membrane-bound metal-dependent hydrolase YbcI (DUF457 family)
MSRTGHIVVGASLAATLFSLDFHLFAIIGVMLGATGPDDLEMSYYNKSAGRFDRVIPHRTITHSIWLWVLCLYCLITYSNQMMGYLTVYGYWFAIGYIYGAFSHLAADICTPTGIPLGNPFGKRFSLNIYKTGKGEWKVLMPVIALSSGLSYSLWSGVI